MPVLHHRDEEEKEKKVVSKRPRFLLLPVLDEHEQMTYTKAKVWGSSGAPT